MAYTYNKAFEPINPAEKETLELLAGPWFLGTNDDSLDIFRGDSGNCAIQSSSTGAGLQLVATGGNCRGQASVSTG